MSLPNSIEKWLNLSAIQEKEISELQGKVAALKAENERLRSASFVTAVPSEQYERVIKAGDAMADTRNKPTTLSEFGHLAMAWLAAKEGRDAK